MTTVSTNSPTPDFVPPVVKTNAPQQPPVQNPPAPDEKKKDAAAVTATADPKKEEKKDAAPVTLNWQDALHKMIADLETDSKANPSKAAGNNMAIGFFKLIEQMVGPFLGLKTSAAKHEPAPMQKYIQDLLAAGFDAVAKDPSPANLKKAIAEYLDKGEMRVPDDQKAKLLAEIDKRVDEAAKDGLTNSDITAMANALTDFAKKNVTLTAAKPAAPAVTPAAAKPEPPQAAPAATTPAAATAAPKTPDQPDPRAGYTIHRTSLHFDVSTPAAKQAAIAQLTGGHNLTKMGLQSDGRLIVVGENYPLESAIANIPERRGQRVYPQDIGIDVYSQDGQIKGYRLFDTAKPDEGGWFVSPGGKNLKGEDNLTLSPEIRQKLQAETGIAPMAEKREVMTNEAFVAAQRAGRASPYADPRPSVITDTFSNAAGTSSAQPAPSFDIAANNRFNKTQPGDTAFKV